jgi:hypothetical protein
MSASLPPPHDAGTRKHVTAAGIKQSQGERLQAAILETRRSGSGPPAVSAIKPLLLLTPSSRSAASALGQLTLVATRLLRQIQFAQERPVAGLVFEILE